MTDAALSSHVGIEYRGRHFSMRLQDTLLGSGKEDLLLHRRIGVLGAHLDTGASHRSVAIGWLLLAACPGSISAFWRQQQAT